MSTLQITRRRTPNSSHRTRLGAGLTALAVLIAITVAVGAILVAHGGARTTTLPSVGSADSNSAAYAPPHYYYGEPAPTQARATGLTSNNQASPAYTKAQLYNTAR